jgi:hypothetical protein
VGEVEKLKGEIAVYLLLRRLAHKLARQADEALPLLELPNVPVLGEETELGIVLRM